MPLSSKKFCANGDKYVRAGMRIIDIDGHVREADDLFEQYLEPPFRARAPKIEKVANGQLLVSFSKASATIASPTKRRFV